MQSRGSDSEHVDHLYYTEFLNRQQKEYHHLQQQAQNLVRIFIAIGGIVVALFSTDIINIISSIPLPSQTIEVPGGGATINGFVSDFAKSHLIIGWFFVGIGVVFVLDSIYWASKALTSEQLREGYGKYPEDITRHNFKPPKTPGSQHYEYWISKNDDILSKMTLYMNKCYRELGVGLLIGLFSLLFFSISYINPIQLVPLDLAVLLITTISLLSGFVYLIRLILLGWRKDNPVNISISDILGEEFILWKKYAPSLLALSLLIPIYVYAIVLISILFLAGMDFIGISTPWGRIYL